jgi:hypothetical protein
VKPPLLLEAVDWNIKLKEILDENNLTPGL